MKKAILFFLFIGISYFSKAQLTVSGFYSSQGSFDTPANTFYTLTAPPAPNFPTPFIADAGTHVYYRDPNNNGANGFYITNLVIRMGNYWYVGRQVSATTGGGLSHSKYLYARTKVIRNSIDPPCVDIWENVSYNGTVITPIGTYFTGTFSGATCDGSALLIVNNTMLPNLTSLPQLTNTSIQAITSPTAGSIVYNIEYNCISLYNGISWNCLGYSNMTTVNTYGYIISNFYNHIVYTGIVTGSPMNIPVASTCPNQEYYITNNSAGNLILSIAFVTGNGTNTTIISQNTTIHLMSDGTNWIKI